MAGAGRRSIAGRRAPLVIKFRRNGKEKEFQAVDVQSAKQYHTSFDCAKAKTEVEKAVCDLSDVAFLDLKVDEVYRSWLDQLNPADRHAGPGTESMGGKAGCDLQ